MTVQLPVASEHWLRTTMVRLGTDAEVIDPPQWRVIGADAAAKVLERYRRS